MKKEIQRREDMVKRRAGGETLTEIGQAYGLTRQRVDQILKKPYGMRPRGRPVTKQCQLFLISGDFLQHCNPSPSEQYYIRKQLVLTHYGNGKCACVLCGFSDLRALSIDHINGGGLQHKKTMHASDIYTWLIKNKFPAGFRTLCMNCQWVTKNENHFTRKSK